MPLLLEVDVIKSRDDIPAILIGLQAIYRNESTRARLKQLLEEQLLPDVRYRSSGDVSLGDLGLGCVARSET